MDSLLNVDPGLLFWSIINFVFFLVALYMIGAKKFINNIRAREDSIQKSIDDAEASRNTMQKLITENELKMQEAHSTIAEEMKQAKEFANSQAANIINEAQKLKETLIKDAKSEIERSRNIAMQEIRNQVADLVVNATEKIIVEKLDTEKDKKLVDLYLQQLSKN